MITKHFVSGLAIGCFLMLPVAFGGNQRSWVSSTGSDSNNCTRSSPCATFQGAVNKTNAGGEVDVVDAGDYGSIIVNQSVTIDGGGMGRIFSSADLGYAVSISGGIVSLKNLSILYLGPNWAISVSGGNVSLLNLSLVGNGAAGGILDAFTSSVTIKNVHISDFFIGLQGNGAVATMTDSLIEETQNAVQCFAGSCVLRNVNITNAASFGYVGSSSVTTLVDSCLITNSGTAIYAGGTVQLTNTTIVGNVTGLASGGTIISFVNNRIYGNGTNGAPTSSVFQK